MDFWLTEDQEALRDGIRSFVEGRFDYETSAEREETDAVIDPATWAELGEMGVFSLRQDGFDNEQRTEPGKERLLRWG